MLFLTDNEVRDWNTLTGRALNNALKPTDVDGEVRSNLRPAFFFHVGSVLAARQRENEAREWFGLGALEEEEGLFMNAFTSAFLERQGGKFHMPASAFEDPRPFMHFASVPIMRKGPGWTAGAGTCLTMRSNSGARPWSFGPSGFSETQPSRPEP